MAEQEIASKILACGPVDDHPGWYSIVLEDVTGLPLSASILEVTLPQEAALWLAQQIPEQLTGLEVPST
jgi:hypothetical protein